MSNLFFNYIIKAKRTFFLDRNERLYVNICNTKIVNNKIIKKNILYSATEGYYPLCFGYLLSKEKKYRESKFIFYLPELAFHNKNSPRELNFCFRNILHGVTLV
jgi:hypothetical protein